MLVGPSAPTQSKMPATGDSKSSEEAVKSGWEMLTPVPRLPQWHSLRGLFLNEILECKGPVRITKAKVWLEKKVEWSRMIQMQYAKKVDFLGGSVVKNLPPNSGDINLI